LDLKDLLLKIALIIFGGVTVSKNHNLIAPAVMWTLLRNFTASGAPPVPFSMSSKPSPNNSLPSPQLLEGKKTKEPKLTVRVSRISSDTLDDAEDRFWSEFCTSPESQSISSVKGNSQDRLFQVLQHLNRKI
jgi:hypothetical protein